MKEFKQKKTFNCSVYMFPSVKCSTYYVGKYAYRKLDSPLYLHIYGY